jgi:hypothetical protein
MMGLFHTDERLPVTDYSRMPRMKWPLVVAAFGFVVAIPAWADEVAERPELILYPAYKAQLQLAEATVGGGNSAAVATTESDRAFNEYRPPIFFSANKLHQYLGIGSITLATLALLAPKDDDGGHGAFGAGAAALGAGAVVTGLLVHGEDVGFSQGLTDPDNLHAIFGTLGAAGFIAAAAEGGEKEEDGEDGGDGDGSSTHAALGIAGYASMLIGIRIAW